MNKCLACLINPDVKCYHCGKSYCHRCFRRDPNTGEVKCRREDINWNAYPPSSKERVTYHLYRFINPEWEEIKDND